MMRQPHLYLLLREILYSVVVLTNRKISSLVHVFNSILLNKTLCKGNDGGATYANSKYTPYST